MVVKKMMITLDILWVYIHVLGYQTIEKSLTFAVVKMWSAIKGLRECHFP